VQQLALPDLTSIPHFWHTLVLETVEDMCAVLTIMPSMKVNFRDDSGRFCGCWCGAEPVELSTRADPGSSKMSKEAAANDASGTRASTDFPEASTRNFVMHALICGDISTDKMKLESTGLDNICRSFAKSFNKQKAWSADKKRVSLLFLPAITNSTCRLRAALLKVPLACRLQRRCDTSSLLRLLRIADHFICLTKKRGGRTKRSCISTTNKFADKT